MPFVISRKIGTQGDSTVARNRTVAIRNPRLGSGDFPGDACIAVRGLEQTVSIANNHDGTRVISKDGKVMTVSGKGTDAAGKPVESTLVFDKR